ncbi:MAG: peptidoglycan editing factor PgeF [Deltaproteobacteria bacterium]|nr:peptidoglycan editing factor PgeF [Deltaproteobacteria bacterium]MBI3389803.1 peptidoglycan editing factor PgeF [Deltaproteobacteria bacterium]
MSDLPVLRVDSWRGIPGLTHGFLGRHGGVSRGDFASLNLSQRTGDDPAAVVENRRRVEALLARGSRLVSMEQEHGDRVVVVQAPTDVVGRADAMVTATPGALLSVLTADCVPILLVAPARRIAAAVHAGWRGTLAGIVTRAVELLRRQWEIAPAELAAALGPAIGGCCYEVDREIGEQLVARCETLPAEAWSSHGAKGMLDLRSANRQLLLQAGIPAAAIHLVGPCTRCAMQNYFSHRGAGGSAGRQLSYIGWEIGVVSARKAC